MATKSAPKKSKPVVELEKISTERPEHKTSKDIPVVRVSGCQISVYNRAVRATKAAKEKQDSIKPAVLKLSVPEILSINCADPDSLISSVRLIDKTGSEVVVSFKDQYQAVNPEAAIQALLAEGVQDVNDYIQEEMSVQFDARAFHTAEGKFNADLYADVRAALQTVAKKHGITTELIDQSKVVKPNANFHSRRFKDFSATANANLSTVLPNTVSVLSGK